MPAGIPRLKPSCGSFLSREPSRPHDPEDYAKTAAGLKRGDAAASMNPSSSQPQ